MKAGSKKARLRVELVVMSDDLHPQIFTDYLGVTPRKTFLKGDPTIPGALILQEINGWVLTLEAADDELFVHSLVDRLIAQIPDGKLTSLCQQYHGSVEVELSVVAHVSDDFRPSIALTSEQIAFLAQCNGSFDVDLYVRGPRA